MPPPKGPGHRVLVGPCPTQSASPFSTSPPPVKKCRRLALSECMGGPSIPRGHVPRRCPLISPRLSHPHLPSRIGPSCPAQHGRNHPSRARSGMRTPPHVEATLGFPAPSSAGPQPVIPDRPLPCGCVMRKNIATKTKAMPGQVTTDVQLLLDLDARRQGLQPSPSPFCLARFSLLPSHPRFNSPGCLTLRADRGRSPFA